eukprot:Skav226934  [mRNA]  locus=scaffold965:110011:119532:+ [translate_table: standard]
MPPIDPRILAPPAPGCSYCSVFRKLETIDAKMTKVWDLAQQQEMLIMGAWLGGDVLTIYNLSLVDAELFILAMTDDTRCFDSQRSDAVFTPRLVELCAGTGSMGVGPSFLGCHVVASVDHTSLACKHLSLNNHGAVLELDLNHPTAALAIHEQVGSDPVNILLGFPCQPFSRQGMGAGQADPRTRAFWSALRVTFLLQARLLITECVPEAGADLSVRQALDSLASVMNWGVHSTCLRLDHQWPMCRTRWWAALYPLSWTGGEIHAWPHSRAFPSIGHVLPFWGLWDASDEQDLMLSVEEYECYTNPSYGRDSRLLTPSRICPTILHSYGNPLADCPCGCRGPLSLRSLASKGLRGVFVISARTSMPRFLHPRELAVLLGIPLTMDFDHPPRAALCLLGLVLSRYKRALLDQIHDSFPFANPVRPVDFVLFQHDGPPVHLLSRGCSTIAQLAAAEAISLGWGDTAMVLDSQQRPVPLESHVTHGQVELHITVKGRRQCKEQPTGIFMVSLKLADRFVLSFVDPGAFLFTVLWEHNVSTMARFVDEHGKLITADFKIWRSLYLEELTPTRFPTLVPFRPPVALLNPAAARTTAGSGTVGLDDVAVWSTMLEFHSVVPSCFVSPREAMRLWLDPSVHIDFHGLCPSTSVVYVIFQANQHWALLRGELDSDGLRWTYFDGLSFDLLPQARLLAAGLSRQLGLLPVSVQAASLVSQTSSDTCGTVALCHLALCLGMQGEFTAQHVDCLHSLFLCRNHKASWFSGRGPATSDVQAQLAAVLATKGVPSSCAADRAAAAMGRLPTQDALAADNQWKALKLLTTKPGQHFQFVLKSELQTYIDQKAGSKHGATISSKKKEKKPSKRSGNEPWVLDPAHLALEPGLFVDAESDVVDLVPLAEVTADARGVAICSLVQAMPYVQEPKHISSDALALLVVEEIAAGDRRQADVSAIRFPVVYVPTGDPLLISGSIVQLGDMEVVRKRPDDPVEEMDIVSTHVLKTQMFRDELTSWEQVAQSPIKHLVQLVPCLRMCTNLHCDMRCGLFHAAVEDSMDQVIHEVWGRRFQTTDGKQVEALKADCFQVFLRVAYPALETILLTQVAGVYFEPRADSSRSTDSSYAVIWLPGANRDAALHKLKLASHGLGLVRMKFRYGIRVLSVHEERTHQELRPGDGFTKVNVQFVYRIHPVPHGLQRVQVTKLLAEWKWLAKPLQPAKGSSEGASWEVGSTCPPPSSIMQAFGHDVLVTLVKDKADNPTTPHVVGPQRVRKQLQSTSSSSSAATDPWTLGSAGGDPWARFVSTTQQTPSKVPSRIAAVTDQIKADVTAQFQQQLDAGSVAATADGSRLSQLEVDVAELKAQGGQFRAWFEETGSRLATQDKQLHQLNDGLLQQQHDLQAVRAEVHTSADNLHQSLQLSFGTMKNELTTELGRPGPSWKVPDFGFRSLFWTFFLFWHFIVSFPGAVALQVIPSACRQSDSEFVDFHHDLLLLGVPPWTPDGHVGVPYVDASSGHVALFHRWGEALNPGPSCQSGVVPFSFANPSGLRGKEEVIVALGPGVHSFAETQLSRTTQRSCAKSLRFHASQVHRDLRVHLGAPVVTRSNSTWAGAWSGVGTISDFPSREVWLPYGDERDCGRLLVTEHFFGGISVQNAVVYGFPSGPTYPQARRLTSSLLQVLTTEYVMGSSGPRIIGGDFNAEPDSLDTFTFWTRMGWRHAQCFALQTWDQPPCLTCKHATMPDHVWMSPEALALCRFVDVADVFSEHSTITVGLDVSGVSSSVLTWSLPSPIPWDRVDSTWSSNVQPPVWDLVGSCDEQWAQLGSSVESSLTGYVTTQPNRALQSNQCGRLQQTAPCLRAPVAPRVRASRPSEVVLRNDYIGSATKSWFRQLRRLQSLFHSTRAGSCSVNAVAYRLELWTSILRASGFQDGFGTWWRYHRSCVFPDAPLTLPSGPPNATQAELIFLNFKACFERFESWHVRQRSQLLRAKYEQGVKALYQDLRKGKKGQLDCLIKTYEYGVLAVDADSGQVHLDQEIQVDGCSVWRLDDQCVEVERINEVVLQLSGPPCEVGQVLVQTQTLHATEDLHSALLNYWTPTWTAWSTVDASTWTRVINFMEAHVPRLDFDLPPISLSQWKRALKRYKPSAARGVDGVSHVDLLHLPDAWSLRILDLLHQIELGVSSWPLALLFGVVNVLAKDDNACTVDRFRPVVVFSVLYRTWSSLRAAQLLRRITPYIDAEAFGFLPGHEPSQLWLVLQSQVELALQSHEELCGLSADLVRAFNHIPRQHSFRLATHLGVPSCVTSPWKAFLDGCSRSFKVRNALSPATRSSCGMPEGDALSVFAMVQLGWVWHIYMRHFCPRVRSLSFVDNLSLVADCPFDLAHGWVCLNTFFELWNLRVDLGKSYCWGLSKFFRDQLACFPIDVVPHSRELGGILSFSKRQHTGILNTRVSAMLPRWDLLRASQAPLCQKLISLATVFWASVLHGINGSGVGAGLLSRLRGTAMKTLRLNKAGVSGLLRLSLSPTPKADPGFWLLVCTVQSFRRLARKEPRLLCGLTRFLLGFDGKLFSGPFSHLVDSLSQLGWHLCPPFFLDHDGCRHHLLLLDDVAMDELLWDGWLQMLSRTVLHRATMHDLDGIDMHLVHADRSQMDALELSLLGSLQAGAFISSFNHSKFDATKSSACTLCGVANTQQHMLVCPKYESIRSGLADWDSLFGTDTAAMSVHLLPSRPVEFATWKSMLLAIPDDSGTFWSRPCGDRPQHLFTDGSATGGPYSYASWSCLNASSGQIISCGWVPGLGQNSDRAELWGAISALRWVLLHWVPSHLWLDAKFVADGMCYFQEHGHIGPWKHHDLWTVLTDLLVQLTGLQLGIHWVPSHLDDTQMTDCFEDWIRQWNGRADSLAGRFNHARPSRFLALHRTLTDKHETMKRRLRMYRQFWFGVAKVQQSPTVELPESVEVESVHVDQIVLSDLILEDVSSLCLPLQLKQPRCFVVSIIEWIHSREGPQHTQYPLSFVELALSLAEDTSFLFPFANPRTGGMDMQPLCTRFTRPTLAYVYKHVRDALLAFIHQLGFSSVLFAGKSKVDLGIHRPLDGLFVSFADEQLISIQQRAVAFFSNRPYRRSADLARPL